MIADTAPKPVAKPGAKFPGWTPAPSHGGMCAVFRTDPSVFDGRFVKKTPGSRNVRSLAGFVAFLILCGLPHLNHPLFDWDRIERATDDRYFLLMAAPEDERADTHLRALLLDAKALRIEAGPA